MFHQFIIFHHISSYFITQEATQQEVYSACAAEMVDAVIEGTNACIFAFGSTGAGKTHSMLGPEGGRRQAKQDAACCF